MENWYAVEQGIYSPRDKGFGFRFYGYFTTYIEASKVAKKLVNARILYVEIRHTFGCKPDEQEKGNT